MSAKQAPPRLPGVRAGTPYLVSAIFFGALFLFPSVPTIALATIPASQSSGHLPWPLVQWALTTPAGVLLTLAVGVLIATPSFIVAQRRILRLQYLSRAIDVTELPLSMWPKRPTARPDETRADRWLGRGPRTRIVSLALLAVATLIALLVVAGFVASVIWAFIQFPNAACGARDCPPQYPLGGIVVASEIATFALSSLAVYQSLRRVEVSSGVWLRYRDWFETGTLYYIRRPGVTPEAVAAGPAGSALGEAVPMARLFAIIALAAIPLFLVLLAGSFLSFWLPTQWIPG